MNNNMEKEIFDIYLDDIIPNRFQPRLAFDEKSLNELADSIRQHGIIQPLVVRKIADKYEIIAGERRYKAASMIGLQKVPAVIMNLDDKQSAEVAVIENIQRKDLTALEEAESYKKLLDKGYLTQDQLASRMGKNQATISNKMRLLGLTDEVKTAILNEKISERHARSLLSLKDPNAQREVLDKIINNRLTVKQTDDLIKTMTEEPVGNNESEEIDSFVPPVLEQTTAPPPFPDFTAAEPPIKTPVVESFKPNLENIEEPAVIPFTESGAPDFAPIPTIDVNQIKEGATDINPVDPPADVNALLGIKPAPVESINIGSNPQMRFIPPLEDEQMNMDMQENNPPVAPVNEGIPSFGGGQLPEEEPVKPEIDSLVPFTPQPEINNPFVSLPSIEQPSVEPTNIEPQPVEQPNLELTVPTTTFIPEVTPPVADSNVINNPKTFTDSLVQEYREVNTPSTTDSGVIPGNLRSAVNIVRDTINYLEKNNFKIDSEEFDFENLYQVIIKIDK